MAVKLNFDDRPSPKSNSRTSTESLGSSVMERGFLGNVSNISEAPVFEETPEHAIPVMSLCRDMITDSLDRFKG